MKDNPAIDRLDRQHHGVMPFENFIENFSTKLRAIFQNPETAGRLALKRGMPSDFLEAIMSTNPLSVGIPSEYGGRGNRIEENLALLSAAAYESLSLSLTLGINSALFLQPVAKYAREEIKGPVFQRFLSERNMGGLMITEPGYGSDALNMQSSYTASNDKYHIQGTKHWAGLTGMADFWLLTAREKTVTSGLKRDIDFFICDVKSPGQQIIVEEYFENLGLYPIPYGRNRLDVEIPAVQRLVPETTGVKMMLDLLHRSRMHFPGMGTGFVQRMLDESLAHTRQRQVGRNKLAEYDQVQHRLAGLQASYTICSAMCAWASKRAGIGNDLSASGLEANAIKTVASDLMQEAAQSATQLIGAQAYKLNHIAGRAILDSRPFQIFEGSNDILYSQITENLVRMMKTVRESNLYRFLKSFRLTSGAADRLRSRLNFDLDPGLPQRRMVELGKILGRIISSEMVINIGDMGFRKDMIENALSMLTRDIDSLLGSFNHRALIPVIDDYRQGSSWWKQVTDIPTP
jgi:alkylation response protein AidB-like acyl-CoA dehydrogenase